MDKTIPAGAAMLLGFIGVTEVGKDGPAGYDVATMSRGLSASRMAPPSPMRAPVPATMSAGLRGVPSVPQRPVAA